MGQSLEALKKRDPRVFHFPIEASDVVHEDACPLCGSAETDTAASVHLADGPVFFETSICRQCLFTYRSKFPGYAWFQARWAQIATQSGEVFNPALEEDRKMRYSVYLDMVREMVPEGARVLDIGGSYGTGASLFKEAGFQVEILEPEDDRVHYAREKLGLVAHHTVLENFEPTDTYDLILWSHNLEHVDAPRSLFAKVSNWLRPQHGVLYLEVPLVWNIIDWSDALFMAHKSNFAEAHIAKLLDETGLTPVHKWYPKLNSPVHADLGVIARAQGADGADKITMTDDLLNRSPHDIAQLYRRLAQFDMSDLPDGPISYRVPFINQFYTTVRYSEGGFSLNQEKSFVDYIP